MSEHDSGRLWPTYALRAWLAALLAQTRRLSERLEKRIGMSERLIARWRGQLERSHVVIRSLEEALGSVDNVLRHHRDAEIVEGQRADGPAREAVAEDKKPDAAGGHPPQHPQPDAEEPHSGRRPKR